MHVGGGFGVGARARVRPLRRPAPWLLAPAIISVITLGETEPVRILGSFMVQMGLGALAGFVLARGAVWAINRLHLDYDGLSAR